MKDLYMRIIELLSYIVIYIYSEVIHSVAEWFWASSTQSGYLAHLLDVLYQLCLNPIHTHIYIIYRRGPAIIQRLKYPPLYLVEIPLCLSKHFKFELG